MTTLTNQYKEGIKREVVAALRKTFVANYPDDQFRNKIYVHSEFPMTEVEFPAIYVTYSEGTLQNAGVGHYDEILEDDGTITRTRHWKFTGTLNFNILALNSLERDRLADGLVNLLAFGHDIPEFKTFFIELHDNDWVPLQVLTDDIVSGGENTGNPPWQADQGTVARLYGTSYRVNVLGEFWIEPTRGTLVQISRVNAYPYLEGSTPPTGTPDPAPWL